jgi:hypothetical protein
MKVTALYLPNGQTLIAAEDLGLKHAQLRQIAAALGKECYCEEIEGDGNRADARMHLRFPNSLNFRITVDAATIVTVDHAGHIPVI